MALDHGHRRPAERPPRGRLVRGQPRGGVRLDFRTPVRWRFLDVPAAYYGVEDLDGFAAELATLGIPGEDARRA